MDLKEQIQKLVSGVLPEGIRAQIVVSEDAAHGHYFTNAAFLLAKARGMNPLHIAGELVGEMNKSAPEGFLKKIEIRAPGFINFFISETTLHNELKKILEKKEKYGQGEPKKQKIQVEFISANPTGPLTLGNGRGGFLGDVLVNVLNKAGYDAAGEYYINDIGRQIQILGASILYALRIPESKLLSLVPEISKFNRDELYKGDYIDGLAKQFKSAFSQKRIGTYLKKNGILGAGSWGAGTLLKDIKKVIKSFGIGYDEWFRESALYKKRGNKKSLADEVYGFLYKNNLLKEEGGAIWFLVSKFEEDRDRVVRRSNKDGGISAYDTYFFSDIVYHWNKFKERKFDRVINIWGADHHGHVKSVRAAVRAIGVDPQRLTFIIIQLVRLVRGGKEVRMSKRKGEYVTLKELIDEVGLDAARFFFIMNAADSHMTFDLELAKEQSLNNPVYYAQYAAVRANGILKKLPKVLQKNAQLPGKLEEYLPLLNSSEDLELLRLLSRFPEIIQETANDYKVHNLTRYVSELSRAFNAFYEKERIIGEDAGLAAARLSLVMGVILVFKNVFSILGIKIPKKM